MLPHNLALATLAAFGLGILTFIGPCAPARLATADRGQSRAFGYIAGATAGFATLGALGALLFTAIFLFSPIMYVAIGVIAIVTGIRQLTVRHDHQKRKAVDNPVLAALSGFASAFTLAPCCSTIIIATLTLTSNAAATATILAAFGLGHTAPMLGLQAAINRLGSVIEAPLELALGGTSLALGVYYLVLA
jgi:cytochrome c biogenesis protein CcdA